MLFWQINATITGGILLSSCISQKEVSGKYENNFYVSRVERPFFLLRGLNTLEFKYNIEFKDYTYLVYNCLCNSQGRYFIKNDSVFLFNEKIAQQDSVKPCFDTYSYKIRNNGKMLTRRNDNKLERLHKLK